MQSFSLICSSILTLLISHTKLGSRSAETETGGWIGKCKEEHFTPEDAVDQGISMRLVVSKLSWTLPKVNASLFYYLQLHNCFMQVNDYRERLKSSEEELQVGVFIPNLNVQKKNNLRGGKKTNCLRKCNYNNFILSIHELK